MSTWSGFSVIVESTCNYTFTKEINHAGTRSQHFNENVYRKNFLRVFSAMTGKPALCVFHTSCHCHAEPITFDCFSSAYNRLNLIRHDTAVFKKVATFNIDFVSRDGNRTHQNAFNLGHVIVISYAIERTIEKNLTAKSNVRFFVLKSRWLCRDFISLSISSKHCSPARKSIVVHSTVAINHMT